MSGVVLAPLPSVPADEDDAVVVGFTTAGVPVPARAIGAPAISTMDATTRIGARSAPRRTVFMPRRLQRQHQRWDEQGRAKTCREDTDGRAPRLRAERLIFCLVRGSIAICPHSPKG